MNYNAYANYGGGNYGGNSAPVYMVYTPFANYASGRNYNAGYSTEYNQNYRGNNNNPYYGVGSDGKIIF
jgi:hypothetical protein